jgi:cell division protein ZipA
MSELRWILLGLGALFCLGLWWWETRRQRQAVSDEPQPSPRAAPESSNPGFWEDQQDFGTPASAMDGTDPLQPMFEPSRAELPATSTRLRRIEPTLGEPMAESAAALDAPPLQSQWETEIESPLEPHRSPTATEDRKIISLRLTAPPPERFAGRALIEALQGAGLEYGKFSIFHQQTADGTTLFSVAGLVEPGAFDLDQIDGCRYPGVTFFTVLSASTRSADAVEMMISTAKKLAQQLHGSLQDESGAPLSMQRLVSLRAEVVEWCQRPQ